MWLLGLDRSSLLLLLILSLIIKIFRKQKKTKTIHALLTILIAGLFQFLETFPSLEGLYLLRWIKGMGLLLFLIGLILLIENEKPGKGDGKAGGKGG